MEDQMETTISGLRFRAQGLGRPLWFKGLGFGV